LSWTMCKIYTQFADKLEISPPPEGGVKGVKFIQGKALVNTFAEGSDRSGTTKEQRLHKHIFKLVRDNFHARLRTDRGKEAFPSSPHFGKLSTRWYIGGCRNGKS